MASPRVFISSTCYDLSEIRDSLVSFFENYGFDCTLSERGDVFYHPDLHTHESCIGEISNCQLFILIVGGRFGGKYKKEDKSITNAEFTSAKKIDIPVFTFIKQEVLNDHNVWQRNKKNEISSKIEYPSIEKQEHAEDIFSFIDQIRHYGEGNSFFGFSLAKDIHEKLRKQLSGMFYDFLTKRKISKQLELTNQSIADLSAASSKIEELVKNIYRHVDTTNAEKNISSITIESKAEEFLLKISKTINRKGFIPSNQIHKLSHTKSDTWWDFVECIKNFVLVDDVSYRDGRTLQIIGYEPTKTIICEISGDLSDEEEEKLTTYKDLYENFINLEPKFREKILQKFKILPGRPRALTLPNPKTDS